MNDTIPPALVASQRTCFICGTNGYTWLPTNWSGTCYIAFLLPPTFTASPDFHKRHYSHRSKRGVIDAKDTAGQEFGDFAKGFFPFWGPMVNSCHIRQLTRVVELTIAMITAWGWTILMIVGVSLTVVFVCCLCLQCLPAICSACLFSRTPERIHIGKRNEHMMLQRETDHIMNIDLE